MNSTNNEPTPTSTVGPNRALAPDRNTSLRKYVVAPALMSAILLAGCESTSKKLANKDPRVRKAVVAKVEDQDTLAKVAFQDTDWTVRKAAVLRLKDQSTLERVAIYDEDGDVRRAAIGGLTDERMVERVASEGKHEFARVAAVAKVTEQSFLAKLACDDPSYFVRKAAVAQLADQGMLTKVVCDTRDWELRKLSFNKLDHTHLQQLAANGKDQAVRLAALVKLKQENWNIIFLPENITDYGLSTVLGAVALVDDPQPTSSSVVAASHSFIRQGDPSRIPELRDLLHRFGDVPLAEDYLNCGQVDLGTAGREWLSSHGYRVVSGPGSHRVRWGGR